MTGTTTSSVIEGQNDEMDREGPRSDGPRRRRVFTAPEKLAYLSAYERACEQGDGGGTCAAKACTRR